MSESLEMYLKVIYTLTEQEEKVHAIDIAKYMHISKPSVSKALAILKKEELATSVEGRIELTTQGTKKAQQILSKYESIKEFLKQTLQLEEQDACINACRMEHIITDTCHQKIEEYLKEQKHD